MTETRIVTPAPASLRRTARCAAGAAAALLLLLAVHPAGAATLTRGPYLQVGTSSEITIRWRTDVATDSRVRFGASPTSLTGTVDDAALVTIHSIKVSGLTPETRYYYSIGSSTQTLAGGTSAYTFRTAPSIGAPRATRVWIIGDSGKPGSDQQRVKNAYLNWTGTRGTDVWLMLGDNAYDSGTDSEYQTGVFNAYPELLRSVCLWPTRGNHDDVGSGTDYYDIFTMPTSGQAGGVPSGTEAYYSFDYGNVHFICLDSEGSSRSRTGAMAGWLASDLATTHNDWIVAYWHHPPYTKGSHDSDSESDLIEMRQNFLPILEAGGVDLVLTGHSHSYERSFLLNGHYGSSGSLQSSMVLDNGDGSAASGGSGAYRKPGSLAPNLGAVYAVAGSSSKLSSGSLDHPAMVVSLYELGSMVLDVSETSLVARFLDDAGAVRDDFTILKEATVGVPDPGKNRRPNRMPVIMSFTAETNPTTDRGARFEYALANPARVSLTIFSVDGRRIAVPVNADSPAGTFEISWDGRDGRGRDVAPGVYFASFASQGDVRVLRVVLLK